MVTDPGREPLERCLELFELHQKRLFLYIRALVPDPAEAEEILHETNIVVWKKVDEFRPGSDFFLWISRIAHFQILDHRRRHARARVRFSPELVDQLAQSARENEPELERRRAALENCRRKLAASDRDLLDACYAPLARVEEIASRTGRAATSLYRSLRRIRQLLIDCVERTLSTES
jgi:RNA polymerase sigma-70 factor (ECF subfamily)